jgi:cell division protein FtsB
MKRICSIVLALCLLSAAGVLVADERPDLSAQIDALTRQRQELARRLAELERRRDVLKQERDRLLLRWKGRPLSSAWPTGDEEGEP